MANTPLLTIAATPNQTEIVWLTGTTETETRKAERVARRKARLLTLVRNMLHSIETADDELSVQGSFMIADGGVMEGWMHFSAGPNAVFNEELEVAPGGFAE